MRAVLQKRSCQNYPKTCWAPAYNSFSEIQSGYYVGQDTKAGRFSFIYCMEHAIKIHCKIHQGDTTEYLLQFVIMSDQHYMAYVCKPPSECQLSSVCSFCFTY